MQQFVGAFACETYYGGAAVAPLAAVLALVTFPGAGSLLKEVPEFLLLLWEGLLHAAAAAACVAAGSGVAALPSQLTVSPVVPLQGYLAAVVPHPDVVGIAVHYYYAAAGAADA